MDIWNYDLSKQEDIDKSYFNLISKQLKLSKDISYLSSFINEYTDAGELSNDIAISFKEDLKKICDRIVKNNFEDKFIINHF